MLDGCAAQLLSVDAPFLHQRIEPTPAHGERIDGPLVLSLRGMEHSLQRFRLRRQLSALLLIALRPPNRRKHANRDATSVSVL